MVDEIKNLIKVGQKYELYKLDANLKRNFSKYFPNWISENISHMYIKIITDECFLLLD